MPPVSTLAHAPALLLTGQVGAVPQDLGTANLLLHGRAEGALPTLAAESLLREGVKLVYLDPPYRTRQRFAAYDDHGSQAAWVAMMRQVLTEAADVLRSDGSVWLQVDDHEAHHARLLLEEVFGEGNFVADIVWERKKKPSFLHGQVAHVTDHILVAAKDRSRLGRFSTGEQLPARRTPMHHSGNPPTTLTFPAGSVRLPGPDRVIPAGDMSTSSTPTRLIADVHVVEEHNVEPLVMEGGWRWNQARLDAEIAAGTQVYAPRLPLRPQAVTGSGERTWTTLWDRASGMSTNEDASEHAKALFTGDLPFDTPKPEQLLERIVRTATEPGDLVVDLYAGSGTTAAVAHKLGRRWITTEASDDVLTRFTARRLTQVVDGTDLGGISVQRTVTTTAKLPDGWSPRDARRAGQWVDDLAAWGALDFLPAEQRERVVQTVRDESTRLAEKLVWAGGGGFAVAELRP